MQRFPTLAQLGMLLELWIQPAWIAVPRALLSQQTPQPFPQPGPQRWELAVGQDKSPEALRRFQGSPVARHEPDKRPRLTRKNVVAPVARQRYTGVPRHGSKQRV